MVLYSYEVGQTPIEGEGKPWFPRKYGESEKERPTKLLQHDDLYSKASEEVESIIREEAKSAGFKKISKINDPVFFSAPPLDEETLEIGTHADILPEIYAVYPEPVGPFIEWAIRHEDQHTKGHSAKEIAKKRLKACIRNYGVAKFDALNDSEQKDILRNVLSSKALFVQYDIHANQQAVREYLNSGLSMEQVKQKIAPALWCLSYSALRKFDETPANKREERIRNNVMSYVDRYFPRTVSKEEMADRVIAIDREYQKRLQEHPLAKRALRS